MKNGVPEFPVAHDVKVELLASTILDGMYLPAKVRAEIILKFGTFATVGTTTGFEDEKVMADLCADYPTIAALIMIRDSLVAPLLSLSVAEVAYFIPLVEAIPALVWGMARTISHAHQNIRMCGLRHYEGRLVLTGQPQGHVNVLFELALEAAASKGSRLEGLGTETKRLDRLLDALTPPTGSPIQMEDFTKQSKW